MIRSMSQYEGGGKLWSKNGKISQIVDVTGNMWGEKHFKKFISIYLWGLGSEIFATATQQRILPVYWIWYV